MTRLRSVGSRRRRGRRSRGGSGTCGRRNVWSPPRWRRSGLDSGRWSGKGLRRRRRRHCGRRGRRNRSGGLLPRRQEREWIDVPLGIIGVPDPEMHVRHIELRVAGRPNRPDRLAFGHSVARADDDRAEVEKRDGETVGGPDRDRFAVARQPPGEGDAASRRGGDHGVGSATHVDPAMAALVVLGASEGERAEDLSVRRPGPRAGSRRPGQASDHDRECCCLLRQHRRQP